MFGIHTDGPTNVLGDNVSGVNTASKVEGRLNNKHKAIRYHLVTVVLLTRLIRGNTVSTWIVALFRYISNEVIKSHDVAK